MVRDIVVFDLDGTLSLADHRRHLVALHEGSTVTVLGASGRYCGLHTDGSGDAWVEVPGAGKWLYSQADVKFTPDWPAFYRACVSDLPNLPVIAALHAHRAAGHHVIIASGRSDEVRAETEAWLFEHVFPGEACTFAPLMRKEGDFTPDDELKRGWLRDGSIQKERVLAVYEDRDSVVAMWRAEGLACFQVAPGAF